MKRHRQADRVSTPSADRNDRAFSLDAGGVWAKSAAIGPQPTRPSSDAASTGAWARYIDSRMKQFGTR